MYLHVERLEEYREKNREMIYSPPELISSNHDLVVSKFRSDVIRGGTICGNELRFETGRREKMSFDRTSAITFYTVESESFEPRFILIVNSIMYFPRVPALVESIQRKESARSTRE